MKDTLAARTRRIAVILIICSGAVTQAQQSSRNRPSGRDVAREIQRVDRDQQLLLWPLPPKNSDAGRLSVLKQIKEDFRILQAVNNKMMAEVWAKEKIDYGHTADMIGQVRSKAVSLKSNLSLPSDSNARKIQSPGAITGLKDLRAALLVLDKSIMSFVNNPLFQKPEVVEVSQAMQASRDLEAVISLSGDLRKLTARLSNLPKQIP